MGRGGSILYPNRDPPLLFKPFSCAATLLKDAKDLRKENHAPARHYL
jgi:hypothetical protein